MLRGRPFLPALVLAVLAAGAPASAARARPGGSLQVRSLIPAPGQAVLGVVVLQERGAGRPAAPRLSVAAARGFPALTTVAVAEQLVRGGRGRYVLYTAVARRAAPAATAAGAAPATIPAALLRAPAGLVLVPTALGAARNLFGAVPAGVRALMRRYPVRPPVLAPQYSSNDPQVGGLEQANLIDGAIARGLGLPCPGCAALREALAPAAPAFTGQGVLSFFDPTEVRFTVSFSLDTGSFAVQVPGGRQIVDSLAPLGFACSVTSRAAPRDTFLCQGPLAAGVSAQGNLQLTPGPAPGMGALLLGSRGGPDQLAPAGQLTGP